MPPRPRTRAAPAAASRLLVICHTHPRLTQGGAEIAAYEQFCRALRAGKEAWFLAANGGKHADRLGSAINQPYGDREFLYTASAFDDFKLSNADPAFEREFGALLIRLRPDVVHFHHFLGVGIEALSYVKRYVPGARVELTLHEYLAICHHFGQMVTRPVFNLCHAASPQKCHQCFPEHNARSFFLRELWIKRFFRQVDQFVSPSHFLRQRYIEWGLPADRISVRDNVLPERAPVLRRPRQPGQALRVAYFGQLSPLKGIDVFLQAARLLAHTETPIVFRIHGTSENQPSSFQEHVRASLADLPRNVTMKGPYRNTEVVHLMSENDVIVVPSTWWENAPLVIDEARAAGCIVVGSDVGGLGERIRQRSVDLAFAMSDAYDLAELLRQIYDSP